MGGRVAELATLLIQERRVAELAKLLRNKGVNRFVHFHTDHWEPFSGDWNRWGESSSDVSMAILDFIEETRDHPYFSKMTLFYNHPVRTFSRSEPHPETADLLHFEPQSPPYWDRYQYAIKRCVDDSNHEFQVHIHHEGVTRGDFFKYNHLSWNDSQMSQEHESARFERYVQSTLDDLRKTSGIPFENWHFLHGMWALNASDTRVCNITDEISILMKNGCIGDFSMPAGRGIVDSSTRFPHTVIPVDCSKGYDEPEAQASRVGDTPEDSRSRFLIWNQGIPFTHCSTDTIGSEHISAALEDWEGTLEVWIKEAPVIGSTAFVKTHAHSMNKIFWEKGVERTYNHPDVMRLFTMFERICQESDVEFCSWTLGEVMEHLYDHDSRLESVFKRKINPFNARSIVNCVMVGVARERFLEMGERESGLYGYYKGRMDEKEFFNDEDIKMISLIHSLYDEEDKILEIAAGVGQISFALEKGGFKHVDFCEFDERRHALSMAMKDALGSRCTISDSDYREMELTDYRVIFVVNAMASALGGQDRDLLLDTVLSGTDVILRYGKYGKDNRIFELLGDESSIVSTSYSITNDDSDMGFIRYTKP